MFKMKVKSSLLLNALEAAAVGGGNEFVLIVSPQKRKVGNEELCLCNISSSNGEKSGSANIPVSYDVLPSEEKGEAYYPVAKLREVAATLSKVTDIIRMETKGSYLELSDIKGDNRIRVELKSKGVVLRLDGKKEASQTTFIAMGREAFQTAVRLGGNAADPHVTINGCDGICFGVDETEKKLTVLSTSMAMLCRAEVPITKIKMAETLDAKSKEGDTKDTNAAEEKKKKEEQENWFIGHVTFVRQAAAKMTGEEVRIAFTPNHIILDTGHATFGCKRMKGFVPVGLVNNITGMAYEYEGEVEKKKLAMGLELATVGLGDEKVFMESREDGQLELSSFGGENKAIVSQRNHEGMMEKSCYQTKLVKMVLDAAGDQLHYHGENEKKIICFSGKVADASYLSVVLPVKVEKKE